MSFSILMAEVAHKDMLRMVHPKSAVLYEEKLVFLSINNFRILLPKNILASCQKALIHNTSLIYIYIYKTKITRI